MGVCPEPWHGGSEAVRPCDGISTGLKYCCADGLENNGIDDYSCCMTPSNIFTLTAIPTPIAIIANGTSVAIVTSSSAIVVVPTATHTQSATGVGSSGFSTSDKIALGCGIGIGLPATLAAILMLWVNRKRERARSQIFVARRHRSDPINRGDSSPL
jgi:hypothetical protein